MKAKAPETVTQNLRTRSDVFVYERMHVADSVLIGCSAWSPDDPQRRPIFRDASIERCRHSGCHLNGAVVERSRISGLQKEGRHPGFINGCAFSDVTVEGPISGLMFRADFDSRVPEAVERFRVANRDFYSAGRVALNVSLAQFATFDALLGVPGDLIVRDPSHQCLLRKARAADLIEREAMTAWAVVADRLIASSLESVVIVLGHKDKARKADGEKMIELRALGLLE